MSVELMNRVRICAFLEDTKGERFLEANGNVLTDGHQPLYLAVDPGADLDFLPNNTLKLLQCNSFHQLLLAGNLISSENPVTHDGIKMKFRHLEDEIP